MDDLQFRRALYADPHNQDPEVIAAQQSDPSKKQFAHDIYQLDKQIEQTLKIPVPDDLCDKLILRQSLANHQVHKKKTRIHLALAASVAIVGGLLLNFMHASSAYSTMSDYALAHVYYEQGAFANDAGNQVSLTTLNQKMAAFDGQFKQTLGTLISADYCRFGGIKSLHLVFQGKTSPVDVFVTPNTEQLAFSANFNDKNLHGTSLAFNQSSIIVVADKNESLAQWQTDINNTVVWSI